VKYRVEISTSPTGHWLPAHGFTQQNDVFDLPSEAIAHREWIESQNIAGLDVRAVEVPEGTPRPPTLLEWIQQGAHLAALAKKAEPKRPVQPVKLYRVEFWDSLKGWLPVREISPFRELDESDFPDTFPTMELADALHRRLQSKSWPLVGDLSDWPVRIVAVLP
jgi:hypothetical protein